MKAYTGVGSRKTPDDVLKLMHRFGAYMSDRMILRSGGAVGADMAFQYGCESKDGSQEIYLAKHCTPEAMEIASKFHPAWNRCGNYARLLHGRNAFQVLGHTLDDPSALMICWTPDGCVSHKTRSINTGGTGTAISIAEYYNIPIFNLRNPSHQQYIADKLI